MDFSAANTSLWSSVLELGVLAGIMLLANVLRRKLPVVRKSLMPTAVLAGFLALILRVSGLMPIDTGLMEMITYHSIALGFIALSLRVPDKYTEKQKDDLTGIKSGAVIVGSYVIQGILGLAISAGLAFTVMPGMFKAAGVLLPMGYGQGPGQANNVGSTYETLGFRGGQSFGLSIAAMGLLVACVVGVVYINILNKQRKVAVAAHDELSGSVTVDVFQQQNEIPVSESVDKLSVQVAMVALIYLATYFVSKGITSLLGTYAPGLSKTLSPIIWGFNFVIGSVIALLFRSGLGVLRKTGIMTRQYPNNYLLSRISGSLFDVMVIAGIATIDIADLRGLWLPFTLMCVLGAIVTFWYLKWICKKVYPDYFYEGFLSMYGMMTGTLSSGILLLREIDPEFKTPAANNLVVGSSSALIFGAPMLVLIGMAPESDSMLFLTFGLLVVYFILLVLFMTKVKRHK
jgi:ESS family glutamate:Na+ symporter